MSAGQIAALVAAGAFVVLVLLLAVPLLKLGRTLDEAVARTAADAALAGAVTHGHNDFKPELARRTLVRALLQASRLEV